MKHSWTKRNREYKVIKDTRIDELSPGLTVHSHQTCRHCGLQKAQCVNLSYFPVLVYYSENDEYICSDRIPFT
jgi:hypothetical protein